MLWARRIGPRSSSLAVRTEGQARQGSLSWEKAPGTIRFPQRSYGGVMRRQACEKWRGGGAIADRININPEFSQATEAAFED